MTRARRQVPETRYATNGGVSIAYQVTGDGPRDIVYLAPGISHLDGRWQFAPLAHVFDRFAAMGRLISYDKRGCGLSDRTVELPSLDEEVADVVAVLDTLGVARAHVFGEHGGSAVGFALAARHPERVASLATYGATARGRPGDGYPWGFDDEAVAVNEASIRSVGLGATILGWFAAVGSPTDDEATTWFERQTRASVSPAGALEWFRQSVAVDVRPLLGAIEAPVLVVCRTDVWPEAESRFIVDQVPNATLVGVPGPGATIWMGDTDAVLDEIEAFLTGVRPTPAPTRVLTTVLFSDIVGSTERAAALGDTEWRALLARHDEVTLDVVDRHGGMVVKSTGDGALATLGSPAAAVAAARELVAAVERVGLELRVGLHFGEVERHGDDVAGVAVHLAARVAALAGTSEVLVSRTVRDVLLGSPVVFEPRGSHALKGIPGEWEVLAVGG